VGRWSERARALGAATVPPSLAHRRDSAASATDKNDITTEGGRCWWEGPPWHGDITQGEFHGVIAAYIARHGMYTPDLPSREPAVLRTWVAGRGDRHSPE
jgi:hypothetical protein